MIHRTRFYDPGEYPFTAKDCPLLSLRDAAIELFVALQGTKDGADSEGLKVRSFCLDLLSSIEDEETAKGCSREEVKEVIKDFFERGAKEKKAGFDDFLNLLHFLKAKVPGLNMICTRYEELIELQHKLPQQPISRVSSWEKIRRMVRSGLFTPTLEQTADRARRLGLHPMPALPRQQVLVNLYPTLDAINLLTRDYREAGRWLMCRVKVLTFGELCRSVKASCERMHNEILQWDDYCLLTVKGKSAEWMADIGYRYLPAEKMPNQVIALDHTSVGKELCEQIHRLATSHFVLFDDGVYSGQQVGLYLSDFEVNLQKHAFEKKPERRAICEKKQAYIHFIFGHFPRVKYSGIDIRYPEMDLDRFKRYGVTIQLHASLLTENIETLMQKEQTALHLQQTIKRMVNPECVQVVTEWKRPDFASTSVFITRGEIRRGHAKYPELRMTDLSVEYWDGVGPITNVIPPYRQHSNHEDRFLENILI